MTGDRVAHHPMKLSMQSFQIPFIITLLLALALPAFGQFGNPGEQPDEVDQMARFLGLDEEQQTGIRAVIEEISPQIQELEVQAEELYRELHEQSGHDFDEAEVRKTAARIGELTGEITALSVILQSRVEGIFTEDQRQRLEAMRRQQPQMPAQPGGGSETDAYGRSPGDPHYGHDHP